jgi:hypothetical protein
MPSTIKSLVTAGVMALSLGGPVLVPQAASAVPAAERATDAKQIPREAGFGLRLTQFNILASPMKRGGSSRATQAAHWVQREHATVGAFEEVAADQLRQLQRTMPGYHFWPRRTFGTRGSAIQIAWRTRKVELRKTGHVTGPFLGYPRAIPYVQLRDKRTHRTFWVMAIHNAPGSHEGERDAETRIEIARLRKLLHTGDPVFVLGDVNERSEFCDKVARATPLKSLDGGTRHHPCPVPRQGGPDWMLGTGARTNDFAKVYNHISDHPALTVHAHVPHLR